MRGLGATTAAASLPEWVVVAFALLTQLGDAWLIFVAVSLLYWFGPRWVAADHRRVGALLTAFALCALATTVGLKSLFGLPRPPGAGSAVPPAWLPRWSVVVYADLATGEGFGFPSGHAIGTTAAYGGAAVLLDVWNRRRRLLAAGGVVAVVALSRLVLGVHYLVDVAVGVLVGAALVVGVRRASDDDPTAAFALAALLGLGALALTLWRGVPSAAQEAAAAVGGGLGGVVGWRWTRSDAPFPRTVGLVGLVVFGGLWAAAYALEPPLPVTVLLDALAVGGILALPWLVGRVASKE